MPLAEYVSSVSLHVAWDSLIPEAKIVDALTANVKYDFCKSIQKVQSSWKTLRIIIQAASSAMQMDMHELLRDQTTVVEYIADQSLIMASNITSLKSSLDALQLNQDSKVFFDEWQRTDIFAAGMHAFQVRLWSDSLINTLLPSNRTAREELKLWQGREFRLSPKDHWKVNGILDYLEQCNSQPHASILIVLGPTCDRDSWVTEFTLDTIQAFQVQSELVIFVMCDRMGREHYTPVVLIKTIICQVLEQRPTLILEDPEIFNSRLFEKTGEFTQSCELLGRMVARLNSIAILIDRIDRCQPDLSDPEADLFRFFVQLIQMHRKRTKIIVTSTEPLLEELSADLPISICQISTRRTPSTVNYRRPERSTFIHLIGYNNIPVAGFRIYVRRNPKAMLERVLDDIMKDLPDKPKVSTYTIERAKEPIEY